MRAQVPASANHARAPKKKAHLRIGPEAPAPLPRLGIPARFARVSYGLFRYIFRNFPEKTGRIGPEPWESPREPFSFPFPGILEGVRTS